MTTEILNNPNRYTTTTQYNHNLYTTIVQYNFFLNNPNTTIRPNVSSQRSMRVTGLSESAENVTYDDFPLPVAPMIAFSPGFIRPL